MKTFTPEEKKHIADSFQEMKTLEDFCELVNYTGSKLFVNFSMSESEIRFLANPNLGHPRYKTFSVAKKSGGARLIHSPVQRLSRLLKCLSVMLQSVYQPHRNAYGFVENRSVAENAASHTGKNYVFNLDLKDFFPSVEIGRVMKRLNNPPFNLNETNGCAELAKYIAWLCCETMEVERVIDGEMQLIERRVLPQGAATSPVITNIICERLDYLLTGLAKRFNLTYTRYADDITFSSNHNVYQKDSEFRKELERIVADQYFRINWSKVRLQKGHVRQEVTGITVNEKVNVTKRYVKQIRLWLYFMETHDKQKALSLFLNSYRQDKGHVKEGVNNYHFMLAVIGGKLNYMRMLKGEDDPVFQKLWSRFEKLIPSNIAISELLDTWERKGIEAAMKEHEKRKREKFTKRNTKIDKRVFIL